MANFSDVVNEVNELLKKNSDGLSEDEIISKLPEHLFDITSSPEINAYLKNEIKRGYFEKTINKKGTSVIKLSKKADKMFMHDIEGQTLEYDKEGKIIGGTTGRYRFQKTRDKKSPLDFDHFLGLTKEYEVIVNEALNQPWIKDVIESKEFYFRKAQEKFDELKNYKAPETKSIFRIEGKNTELPFYEGAIHKIKKFYSQNKGDQKYNQFLEEIGTSPDAELFKLIGELIAHIDKHASNKEDWNSYEDKRVIARSTVRQDSWARNLLAYKKNGNDANATAPSIRNALMFIDRPFENLTVLSENHRAKIAEGFLGIKYDPNAFFDQVKQFFNYFNIPIQNPDNVGVVYSKIFYDDAVKPTWEDFKTTTPEDDSDSLDESSKLKRSAPFWSDSATEIDEFGRESLVKAIVRSTNKLFEKESFRDSYTIHLNGEWGSGKSSMLKFFKKDLEATGWKIVQYNAWENQSFRDPWWILINAISKRTTKGDFKGKFNSHRYWKFKLQYRHKLAALALILVFAVSAYFFSTSSEASADSVGFYGSLIGLVGAIISVITGLTTNFFYKDVSKEDLKEQFSDHPFKPIRDRFDVIAEENRLAIFIDDLDRCDVDATVTLLEGIQNLFKGKKVLYIIAADGAWVSQCFTKKYENFKDLEHSGVRIGDKFLQKTFQLRVDVPEIGEDYLRDYWNRLINHKEASFEEVTNESIENEVEDAPKADIEDVLTETEKQTVEEIKEQKQELDRKLEEAEEDVEENIESILSEFLKFGVPKNPRQMKRFVNQYVVARQTRIIESGGNDDFGNEEKDIKELIFSMKYPSFFDAYRKGDFTLEKYDDPKSETRITEVEREEIEKLIGIS